MPVTYLAILILGQKEFHMKTVTRKNVFETNSSSSHSLTMDSSEVFELGSVSDEEVSSGKLQVYTGEYGWEWQRYYTVKGKLAYLVTELMRISSLEDSMESLKEMVKRRTGFDLEVIVTDSYYIDHESHGVASEVLQDLKKLESFVFSNSFVETGNDNDSAPAVIDTDLKVVPQVRYYAHLEVSKKQLAKKAVQHQVEIPYNTWETTEGSINGTPASYDSILEFLSGSVVVAVTRKVVPPTKPSYRGDSSASILAQFLSQVADWDANVKVLEGLPIVDERLAVDENSKFTSWVRVKTLVLTILK